MAFNRMMTAPELDIAIGKVLEYLEHVRKDAENFKPDSEAKQ